MRVAWSPARPLLVFPPLCTLAAPLRTSFFPVTTNTTRSLRTSKGLPSSTRLVEAVAERKEVSQTSCVRSRASAFPSSLPTTHSLPLSGPCWLCEGHSIYQLLRQGFWITLDCSFLQLTANPSLNFCWFYLFYKFKKIFNGSLHSIFCVSFWYTARWLDEHTH